MKSKLLAVLVVGLITSFFGASTSRADLATGLVAYYPFNGNANDASAYGVNGAANNGASYTTGVNGQAVHFDGVNDYVNIPAHSSRSFHANSFSVVFWFRTTEQDFGYMLDSRSSSPERGYSMIIHTSGPGVVWAPQNDSEVYPGPSVGPKNNSYQDGNWHMVAGLREPSSIAIFLDGALVERKPIPANLNVDAAFPIYVGKRFYTYNQAESYTGDLDELRIYNRVLSASEIQQLYLGGGGSVLSVGNAQAKQRPGTKLVDILYDLISPQGNPVAVSITVSTNNGASFNLPATSFSPANGSSVTPGNSRQATWNAGADWNNQFSSQVKFRVTASGAAPADSAAVTVDTRDGSRPVVQEVKSAYCDGMKHAYFLNGVSLPLEFEVVPNWNGKTPGSIQFIGPWGTHTQSGTQTKRTYNVGTDFGVGNHLTVKLVADDGTESWQQQVNLDVINPPPLFSASDLVFQQGKYVVQTDSHWQLVNEGSSTLPKDDSGKDIPGCTGKPLSFASTLALGGEIPTDGTWGSRLALAKSLPNFDLLGIEVKPSVSGGVQGSIGPQGWSVEGFVGMNFKIAVETPPFPLIPAPPIYGKWSLHLDQAIEGHVVYDPAKGLYPSGKFPGDLYLDFVAGLGINKVISVEAFVGGGPYWQFQWPQLPVLDKWGVKIHGGIRYLVFIYKGEWSLEYTLIGRAGQSPLQILGAGPAFGQRPPLSEFTLMSRDYLKARPRPLPAGGQGPEPLDLDSASESSITNNIFPYTQPQLGVAGTNRLIVWIADAGLARSDEN